MRTIRERSTIIQIAGLVGIVVGLSYMISTFSHLLIPLVVAVFIWFLINALIHAVEGVRLRGHSLPRFVSATIAIGLIIGTLISVINLVTTNLALVVGEAPFYQEQLIKLIEKSYAHFGMEEPPTIERIIGQVNFRTLARDLAFGVTAIIGNAGLILVYVIFLFLEQNSFAVKLKALAGREDRHREWKTVIRRMGADIRRYIGIKTLVSLLTGVLSYIVIRLVGIDFPFFWAFLIFLLNYIPTIGSIIATVFPTVVSLIQFEDFEVFVATGLSLTTIQVVIGNIIEPRLMGNTLNLSPLVILLSLAYWSYTWGVFGAFLCVPLTVVVMIVLSNFSFTRPIVLVASRDGIPTRLIERED